MRDQPIGETRDDALCDSKNAVLRCEPQLVIALECDRPMSGSARYSLANLDQVVIGRGGDREIVRRTDSGYTTLDVRVPAPSMSSTHARFLRSHGTWILEDAGSRNGSFVNGQRVTRAAIGERDIVEVGHVLVILREAVPQVSTASDLDSRGLAAEPSGFRTLSPALQDDFAALKRLAGTKVPVLFMGETGTGKELLTRGLHRLSGRGGPFVPINCGALSPSLIEAELFGHVKGAFSGATHAELGFIRSADGGTLFLDEVGELPRTSQATLLRVLEDEMVAPVGSTRGLKVSVRFISATNRDLRTDPGFRPDLLARLAGFTFELPPLRERALDVGIILADLLAGHPSGDTVTLVPELGRLMLEYPWPYNVRELHQALRAALPLADDRVLRVKHFPSLQARVPRPFAHAPADEPVERGIDDEDRRLRTVIISRLRETEGNVAAVARSMDRATVQIHRWMKRFGLDPNDFRTGGRHGEPDRKSVAFEARRNAGSPKKRRRM
jgi:DNA-binding NtrC family response regulator